MWCYFKNIECNLHYCYYDCRENSYSLRWCNDLATMVHCDGICLNCSKVITYFNKPNQFNYECPDCKGKFNQAFYKMILRPYHTGTDLQDYYYGYVCPFCGKIMEGLI